MRQSRPVATTRKFFFIGGAELYRLVLDRVERIYLTQVEADVDGDAHFPPFDRNGWKETSREAFPANELNDYPHQFIVLDRIRDGAH